jgi:hypothetical protein
VDRLTSSWAVLTHGTNGLVLAYALTLFALIVTLVQQRAEVRFIFLSPILALPCALVGAVTASAAVYLINARETESGSPTGPLVSVAVLLFAGFASGMIFARRPKSTDTHKRGTVIESAKPRGPTPFGAVTLAGVEIPELDETKHFKLLGTTGSGKSTAIREVLRTALSRGDRAIIADPDRGYLKQFYTHTRGDVTLNPFEEQSYRWDLFGEIEKPYDVEQVARSLISEGADDARR